ncbi:MAG: hypothetical protein GXY83_31835 [Rhodopirellula sp.]|nr:hypothetical protein [Rhodopirellula sp.]
MESSSQKAASIVHAQLKSLQDELRKLTERARPTVAATNERPEVVQGAVLIIRGK